ncbi:MAG: hypothetical protein AAF899_17575 [Pseudomonadota bacterium]
MTSTQRIYAIHPSAIPTIVAATLIALPLLSAASGATAEGRMTAEDFRDFAEGYTLHFERDGQPWGRESFREGGGVTWQYPSGSCVDGVWRGYEDSICFYYGQGTDVLCWSMRRDGDAVIGTLTRGSEEGLELTVTRRDRVPLVCGEAEGL